MPARICARAAAALVNTMLPSEVPTAISRHDDDAAADAEQAAQEAGDGTEAQANRG
jgi:hypothetical protein